MTRMSQAILCFWSVLVAVGVPHHASAVDIADFSDYSLRNASNQVLLPGRLFIPPESQLPGAAPRPLMIFLHGSGANGTNNLAQLAQVTDLMIAEAKDRGAFLYVPQATSTWSSQVITNEVMTMVDRAISTLNADTNRVYLTGYSLGSYGTWTMLSRYDGRFAAAIPLSGGIAASDFVASRLVDTPIFAIHSRDDPTTSVGATRSILNGILTAAHEPLPTYLAANNPSTFVLSNSTIPYHTDFRKFIHDGENSVDFLVTNPKLDLLYYEPQLGGHITLGAFNSPLLYDWMFAHSLAVPEPSGLTVLLICCVAATMLRCRKSRLKV